jgi:hypothetical protein
MTSYVNLPQHSVWAGKGAPEPVAQFSWHKAAITSVEWDPNDESMIGVAGADNQVNFHSNTSTNFKYSLLK